VTVPSADGCPTLRRHAPDVEVVPCGVDVLSTTVGAPVAAPRDRPILVIRDVLVEVVGPRIDHADHASLCCRHIVRVPAVAGAIHAARHLTLEQASACECPAISRCQPQASSTIRRGHTNRLKM
jgi:hypothetical protein